MCLDQPIRGPTEQTKTITTLVVFVLYSIASISLCLFLFVVFVILISLNIVLEFYTIQDKGGSEWNPESQQQWVQSQSDPALMRN